MAKLSSGQLKAASGITGNVSAAWFSIGVISPILLPVGDPGQVLAKILGGMFGAGIFAAISLYLARRLKS